MRSDLTSTEMSLQLKIDKKKSAIHELALQKSDLEKVSKDLYDELQNALMVSARLEQDNNALRDLIDEYRAGDASVTVVREKLEIEYERSKSMEQEISTLHHEMKMMERAYKELSLINERLELQGMEYREEMAGLNYDLDKQKKRTDILSRDNLSLEETSKNLKGHIVKLNDRIVDIKGSIRVFCRVRPLFVDEIADLNITQSDLDSLVRYPDYNILDFNSCPFEFDRVFDPKSGQDDIYEEVEPFVRSAISGCRVCIFA
jgi:kinesin family member C1